MVAQDVGGLPPHSHGHDRDGGGPGSQRLESRLAEALRRDDRAR